MIKKQDQEIKFLQQMSFSADVIARSMKIPVETVCDVLGYPHDSEGRMNAHQDYNYYYHGMNCGNEKLETYILYLGEGDFEKWQPVCYMDKNSDEFLKLREEANQIPKSDNIEEEVRRLWILQRFPVYVGKEWGIISDTLNIKIEQLDGYNDIINEKNKAIEKSFFI